MSQTEHHSKKKASLDPAEMGSIGQPPMGSDKKKKQQDKRKMTLAFGMSPVMDKGKQDPKKKPAKEEKLWDKADAPDLAATMLQGQAPKVPGKVSPKKPSVKASPASSKDKKEVSAPKEDPPKAPPPREESKKAPPPREEPKKAAPPEVKPKEGSAAEGGSAKLPKPKSTEKSISAKKTRLGMAPVKLPKPSEKRVEVDMSKLASKEDEQEEKTQVEVKEGALEDQAKKEEQKAKDQGEEQGTEAQKEKQEAEAEQEEEDEFETTKTIPAQPIEKKEGEDDTLSVKISDSLRDQASAALRSRVDLTGGALPILKDVPEDDDEDEFGEDEAIRESMPEDYRPTTVMSDVSGKRTALFAIVGGLVIVILVAAGVLFIAKGSKDPEQVSKKISKAKSSLPVPSLKTGPNKDEAKKTSGDKGAVKMSAAAVAPPPSETPVKADSEPQDGEARKEEASSKAEPAKPIPPEPLPLEKPKKNEPVEKVEPEKKTPPVAKAEPEKKSPPKAVQDGDTVEITLTGVPAGAKVFVDRQSATLPIIVPKSDKSVKIEVKAEGYEKAVRRVVALKDKFVRFKMKKAGE